MKISQDAGVLSMRWLKLIISMPAFSAHFFFITIATKPHLVRCILYMHLHVPAGLDIPVLTG